MLGVDLGGLRIIKKKGITSHFELVRMVRAVQSADARAVNNLVDDYDMILALYQLHFVVFGRVSHWQSS